MKLCDLTLPNYTCMYCTCMASSLGSHHEESNNGGEPGDEAIQVQVLTWAMPQSCTPTFRNPIILEWPIRLQSQKRLKDFKSLKKRYD